MTCSTVRATFDARKAEGSPGRKIRPPALPPPPALFTDPGLPTGAKLIIRTLVANWAWSRPECWPGTPAIVAATGLSRGHVQTCLRALERGGWIAREARGRRRIIVLLWRLPGWPGAPAGDLRARQAGGAPAPDKNVVIVNREMERPAMAEAIRRPRRGEGPAAKAIPPAGSAPVAPIPAPPPSKAAPELPPARESEAPQTPMVALTARETARLQEASPSTRERVLTWLATGDPVLVAEARKRLRPPPEARPAPTSTAEMLARIRECPSHVSRAAELLALDLDDRKSWAAYHARCRDVWEGRIEPEALVEAHRQAVGPQARNRGAVFMHALKWRAN